MSISYSTILIFMYGVFALGIAVERFAAQTKRWGAYYIAGSLVGVATIVTRFCLSWYDMPSRYDLLWIAMLGMAGAWGSAWFAVLVLKETSKRD